MDPKNKLNTYYILLAIILLIGCDIQNDEYLNLRGSYLGQKPPGIIPEIFVPGLLNTESMRAFGTVFSPDGNEFYFVHFEKADDLSGGIKRMRRINDKWTKPVLLSINSETWDNDMCLSPDGKTIIFRSFRDLPGWEKPDNEAFLWFAERTENGWGKPQPLLCGDKPVISIYPSMAENMNLYFPVRGKDKGGIYRSKPVDGKYGAPQHVFSAVDSINTEGDLYVAPDESYMIISCSRHPDNTRGSRWGDLYITFRLNDDSWSEEINLGETINTELVEYCPQVTPDGKYLFFTRFDPEADSADFYWVYAKIIDELKLEVFRK